MSKSHPGPSLCPVAESFEKPRRSDIIARKSRIASYTSHIIRRRRRRVLALSAQVSLHLEEIFLFLEHIERLVQDASAQRRESRLKKYQELCDLLQDRKQNAEVIYYERSSFERSSFTFPHESRTLIESSAIIQNVYRSLARAGLQSLNLRLWRRGKHMLRVFRTSPKPVRRDCTTPDLKLGEPGELVTSATTHVECRSGERNVGNGNAQESLHSFRRASASCSSGMTPQMASSPSSTKFQVFISHAGEDKSTIALPLRDMLRDKGIRAFVDEKDLSPGGDAKQEMVSTMETAQLGFIILSPEFVAREWPVKELLCFLKRRREAILRKESYPIVIPMFYRLSIADLYKEPQLGRRCDDGTRLYESARFFDRQARGDPEADIPTIQSALRELHGITGVRNDIDASNASSHLMYTRREILLKLACDKIVEALAVSHSDVCYEDTNQIEQQTSQRIRSARTRWLSIWQLRIFKLRSVCERKVLNGFNGGCRIVSFSHVVLTCERHVVWST